MKIRISERKTTVIQLNNYNNNSNNHNNNNNKIKIILMIIIIIFIISVVWSDSEWQPYPVSQSASYVLLITDFGCLP